MGGSWEWVGPGSGWVLGVGGSWEWVKSIPMRTTYHRSSLPGGSWEWVGPGSGWVLGVGGSWEWVGPGSG